MSWWSTIVICSCWAKARRTFQRCVMSAAGRNTSFVSCWLSFWVSNVTSAETSWVCEMRRGRRLPVAGCRSQVRELVATCGAVRGAVRSLPNLFARDLIRLVLQRRDHLRRWDSRAREVADGHEARLAGLQVVEHEVFVVADDVNLVPQGDDFAARVVALSGHALRRRRPRRWHGGAADASSSRRGRARHGDGRRCDGSEQRIELLRLASLRLRRRRLRALHRLHRTA